MLARRHALRLELTGLDRRRGRGGRHLGRRGDTDRRPRPTRCARARTATRSSSSSTPGSPARAATSPRCSPRSTRRPPCSDVLTRRLAALPDDDGRGAAARLRGRAAVRRPDAGAAAARRRRGRRARRPRPGAGGRAGARVRRRPVPVRPRAGPRHGVRRALAQPARPDARPRRRGARRRSPAARARWPGTGWPPARSTPAGPGGPPVAAAEAARRLYAYDEAVDAAARARSTALERRPGRDRRGALRRCCWRSPRSHQLADNLVELRETVHQRARRGRRLGDPDRELRAVGLLVTKALWQSGSFGQVDERVVGDHPRAAWPRCPSGDSEVRCRAMIAPRQRDLLRLLAAGARGAVRARRSRWPAGSGTSGLLLDALLAVPLGIWSPASADLRLAADRRGGRARPPARRRHRRWPPRWPCRPVPRRSRAGSTELLDLVDAARGPGDAGATAVRPAVPRRAGDPVAGDARRASTGCDELHGRHGGHARADRRPPERRRAGRAPS